jgi:predicted nucleic acid-binding protein
VAPITQAVLEKVIDLRSQFNLKVPDAIHIATGILAGCDVFVTGDEAWGKTGVTVVDPADISP